MTVRLGSSTEVVTHVLFLGSPRFNPISGFCVCFVKVGQGEEEISTGGSIPGRWGCRSGLPPVKLPMGFPTLGKGCGAPAGDAARRPPDVAPEPPAITVQLMEDVGSSLVAGSCGPPFSTWLGG